APPRARPQPRPAPTPPPPPAPPPPPKAFAKLEPVEGGSPVELRVDRNEVGRLSRADGIEPEVDLTPYDSAGSVSRRHAVIVRDGPFVVLEDHGSSNGTYVNGTKLEKGLQKTLEDQDEICFGRVAFKFRKLS
ncbi:MAG: FHA domain-containing protein, partial [Candidatus Eremiobacteraeota bacterium]|nr:FHA domain-containing protein [Candidatus Eremiobacteraeota bacterium]